MHLVEVDFKKLGAIFLVFYINRQSLSHFITDIYCSVQKEIIFLSSQNSFVSCLKFYFSGLPSQVKLLPIYSLNIERHLMI